MLRLLDPSSAGDCIFTIDDIDVFKLKRSSLRCSILAVPQDCVFLPDGSTIKSNIDPTESITDHECTSILEKVQLSTFVLAKGGIEARMTGDELSAGQQQLFNLGRAIYRRMVRRRLSGHDGGLLLLDEMGSAVDSRTEATMQKIIHEEFATYTVIAITHHLHAALDFADRVAVLDKGTIVEVGAPKELLERPNGTFRKLYLSGQK